MLHSNSASASSSALLDTENVQLSKSAFKTVETSTQLLGLATPASRVHNPTNATNFNSQEFSNNASFDYRINSQNESNQTSTIAINPLKEGEIIRGLNVNDPLLPSRRHLIGQLLAAVDHVPDLQVSSAALRVLSVLAEAPQLEPPPSLYGIAPNRLVTIVREEAIVGGEHACIARFRRRLEREENEDPSSIASLPLSELLSPECELSPEQLAAFGLTNYIRLQIVQLLLRGVGKRSYNLSHLLLGFSESSTKMISESGCLALLVDLLEYGLGEGAGDGPVLLVEHSTLGMLVLQLIKELLGGPQPYRQSALEYLRHERGLIGKLAGWLKAGWADSEQMAIICEIFALDLHEAMSGDDGVDTPYAIQTLLLDGLLAHDNQTGESRLVSFILDYSSTSSSKSNSNSSAFIQSWSLLTARILDISGVGDLSRVQLQLRQSLQVLLPKLMLVSSDSALESLLQLAVSLDSLHLPSQITLLPELSPASRCLIYALLLKNPPAEEDQLRLLQVACRDALNPSLDMYTDSLSTIALTFIQSQLQDRLSKGDSVIEPEQEQEQEKLGEISLLLSEFIPALMSSLVTDDALLASSPSVVLKWQAKWSLLATWLTSGDREAFLQSGWLESLLGKIGCMRLPFLLANQGSDWRAVVKPVLACLRVAGPERINIDSGVREALVYQFSRQVECDSEDESVILALLGNNNNNIGKGDLIPNNKSSNNDSLLKHAVFDKLVKTTSNRDNISTTASSTLVLLEWLGNQQDDCLKELKIDFSIGSSFSLGHLLQIAKKSSDNLGLLERALWCIGRVLASQPDVLSLHRREASVTLFPFLQSVREQSRFCREMCSLIMNLFKEQL